MIVKSGAPSNTEVISSFVATVTERDLPPEVVDTARLCLADWAAVCVGAHKEPAARTVHAVSRTWSASGSSTMMLGGRSNASVAALCNGTLAHCLDFDDTYVSANTHASAPLWAAALALGEEINATRMALLMAFIAGFEVTARVGYGLGEAVTGRGWHATGAFGRIGSAAACASLLQLNETRVAHSLGAAATQVSGLVGSFGTMSKPFHAGKAAMDGVISAQLAAADFEASTHLLEPGQSLDGALIQDRAATIRPADFSTWELLNNSFKPYAACHLGHAAIDAARELGRTMTNEDRKALHRIDIYVGELAHQVIGGKNGVPTTPLEAKFDLKYCVALAMHGSRLSADDFHDTPDPAGSTVSLARSVHIHPSKECGYTSARIEAEFIDGSVRTGYVSVAKGHPGNPMSWNDMWQKFQALVEPVASARTEEIFEVIRQFGGRGETASPLVGLLSRAMQKQAGRP